jgi:hypothetical protein
MQSSVSKFMYNLVTRNEKEQEKFFFFSRNNNITKYNYKYNSTKVSI